MTPSSATLGRMRLRGAGRHTVLAIPFLAAGVAFSVGALTVGGFASGRGLNNIMEQAVILAAVAAAQTVVIVGGGIDLSVPWVITGAGVFATMLAGGQNSRLVWVVPVLLAIAAGVGLANGIGVAVVGVPPIVMTMAMNVILSGFVILYGSGASAQAAAPSFLGRVVSGHVAGVPAYLLVLAVILAAYAFFMSRTVAGRRLYAVGTSPVVSRLSGVSVGRTVVLSYVMSSVTAAFGGILLLGYVNYAYFGMGDDYLFTSVAAVVIGGASILGGSGHFVGTLGGALLLSVAQALLAVLNLGQGAVDVFYGLIILGSMIVLSDPARELLRLSRDGSDEQWGSAAVETTSR